MSVKVVDIYLKLLIIHALITHLDYCNGLLYGLPKSQTVKLQCVQNVAARLVLILLSCFMNLIGYQYNIVFILRY